MSSETKTDFGCAKMFRDQSKDGGYLTRAEVFVRFMQESKECCWQKGGKGWRIMKSKDHKSKRFIQVGCKGMGRGG